MTENRNTDRNISCASIAVSMGDPAGIGPDIILKAWSERSSLGLPHFTVIGDIRTLEHRSALLALKTPISKVDNGFQAIQCHGTLPVIEVTNQMNAAPGIAEPTNTAGVVEAIECGVEMVLADEFLALTTCPVNKNVLYEGGFKFPGHTEFLAFLSKKITGNPAFPVMMLSGPQLRSVPVTIHVALNKIKNILNQDMILKTVRIVEGELRKKFGIPAPVLVIAGLNPHAGESGTIGDEEIKLITPAVKILKKEGINIMGPMSADTMFHKKARETYDAAICMYHDQALIPAKTLAFDETVNVTLGLSFIRTSPDHGVAYNLAGTGKARPDSFISALQLAKKMVTETQDGKEKKKDFKNK